MPWQLLVNIRRRGRGLAASVIVVASLLAVSPAQAQTAAQSQAAPPRADAREQQARGLFARGRYAEALEIYVSLYAETAHPTYIRNIGRCYQNLGEADKAVSTFREYLRQAKTLTSKQRDEIEGYIREMEELKQKRAAQAKAPPATKRSEPAATDGGEAATAPPRPRERHDAVASRESTDVTARPASGGSEDARGSAGGRKTAAIVTGAAGVAALGVGAYFGLRAFSKRSASDQLCSSSPCGSMDGVELNNEAKTAARVSDFALGAGVVAVGVAAVLFLTAGSASAPAPQASGVHLAPALAADGRSASLSLAGAW